VRVWGTGLQGGRKGPNVSLSWTLTHDRKVHCERFTANLT